MSTHEKTKIIYNKKKIIIKLKKKKREFCQAGQFYKRAEWGGG